jgi:signal transduction histidine kinase/streptogramin lyase
MFRPMPSWLIRVVGVALLVTPAVGEAQGIRFSRLGLKDGMSQASAYSIVQGVDGFLWVGTQNGLNRFDGVSFQSVWMDGDTPSPVGYAHVRSLFSDSHGRLWVGLENRGLYLFDRFREKFDLIPVHTAYGSPWESPNQYYEMAEFGGEVLVGTEEGVGAIEWDSARPTLRLGEPRTDGCGPAVTALWAAGDTLWLGTGDGCLLLETSRSGSGDAVVPSLGVAVTSVSAGPGDAVLVTTDGRGMLVFGRDGRLRSDHPHSVPLLPTDQVTSALTSRTGDTWIGTLGGLGWIQAGRPDTTWFTMGSATAGRLPHQAIEDLYEDRSGVLWVGTWSGLARLSPLYRGIRFIPELSGGAGEPVGGVVSILPDGPDRLLTGSLGGVLARVSRSGVTPGALVPGAPKMADIHSMAWGPRSDLWVGTFGSGIYHRTASGWRSYREGGEGRGTLPDDNVASIFVDRAGTVWAGTGSRGLTVYDPVGDRFRGIDVADSTHALSGAYTWPIREADTGALWFGSNGAGGGLYRLSSDRRTLDFFGTSGSDRERPNAGRILTLLLGGDSLVWFGTQGGGLGRLDPRTGEIRSYTTEEGLPHDNVEGILEDRSGMMWITTNRGLTRFDPATEEFWIFTEDSGIQSSRFFANSAFAGDDGRLYFGGPNGVTVIDPTLVEKREVPPPVALVRFVVGGVERMDITNRSSRSGVDLGPRENFFTVRFAALDLAEAGQSRFQYKLDDFEEDWVDAGADRAAHYTGVPPGRYTFRVQARNSEGTWNRDGLAIPLLLRAPYYQTPWFRALAAAAILGLLAAAYFYRRQQLERVRAMRLQIAGELHDDIGANLSAIALKSDLVARVTQEEERSGQVLGDIQRLAHDTMQKVREMIWVVSEEHDSIEGLLTRMEDSASTLLADMVDFQFTIDPGLRSGQIGMETRQNVYRVFKEALQNVMKHADADFVTIDASRRGADLVVTIVDDGCGFDELAVHEGTGLKLIKMRDRVGGAQVTVSSSPGTGTAVAISVRIR